MSSRRWLDEHFRDPYVKSAQQEGYISRAAYKLLAIQEKDKLLKPGMTVVDLGAAPGGWSQVSLSVVGRRGKVIALDRLPMEPISGVTFIQGDFTEQSVLEALFVEIGDQAVDVVISDMAPNLSGQAIIDQPRSMYLVELAYDCARQILKPSGDFLVKLFQGTDVDAFLKTLRQNFRTVKMRKPDASRARSREVYVLARGFIGYTD